MVPKRRGVADLGMYGQSVMLSMVTYRLRGLFANSFRCEDKTKAANSGPFSRVIVGSVDYFVDT